MADRKWVEEALLRFETPLTRYALSLLGDLDRARDVVQETFLRLCEQDRRKVEDHAPQWLFRVCRNLAVDACRRERPMRNLEMENPRTLISQDPNPAVLLERKEQLSRVDHLLEGLTDNQREVIRLKFQSGLSYREISEVTGLSVGNVGFLIHTAVKKIREQVRAQDPVPSRIRRVK